MEREQTIHHTDFSLSYNSSYVLPSWVAYCVTKSQVNYDDKVKQKFKEDPAITSRHADKKDYKKSGYVMGQLVSYLDLKHSEKAVAESFYLSVIAPMKLAFHNHMWLTLEKMIRAWVAETDALHIVAGPILTDAPFPTIGKNKVSVPQRYYKAVYDEKNQRAIGFILKNGSVAESFKRYAVTLDEIEHETGIDLFPHIDDNLEPTIESTLAIDAWDFNVLE
jgi:endonuclease G